MRRVSIEIEHGADDDLEIVQVELDARLAFVPGAREVDMRVRVMNALSEIEKNFPRYRAANVRIRGRW